MKAAAALFTLVLAIAAGAVADDQPPFDRDAVVRAALDRADLLKGVRFDVPIVVWREYLRQMQGGPQGNPPPAPFIPEEGAYSISVDKDGNAMLSARLTLRSLRPELARAKAVLTADKAWKNITVNGKATALAAENGWLMLSMDQPGVYEVAAELPLAAAKPYDNSVRLKIPDTVRRLVDFNSPGAWEVVAANAPGRIVGSVKDGTKGRLGMSASNELKVDFARPRERIEQPPSYQLSGEVAWNIDAAGQQVAANLNVAIIGGGSDKFVLTLPPGADRVEATGPDVREIRREGDKLLVFLGGKLSRRIDLAMKYDLPATKETVLRFNPPQIADGRWAGGVLVVTNTTGSSETLASSATGLKELAVGELPAAAAGIMRGPMALAYEISAPQWSAAVETVNLGQFSVVETIADVAHMELAFIDDGTIMCKASYEMRNRTRQFLQVGLPAGAAVLAANVNEEPRQLSPVPGRPGAYRLPLARSKASVAGLVSFPVEIVYLCRVGALSAGKGATAALPLPTVDVPVAYAWVEARVPDAMDVLKWRGTLRHVEQYSNQTAVAELGYGRGELVEKPLAPAKSLTPAFRRLANMNAPATKHDSTWAISGANAPVSTLFSGQKAYVPVASKLDIARNYYRAGNEAYEKNKYAEAAENYKKAAELAPGTFEAQNAKRLLGNTEMLAGQKDAQKPSASGLVARKELAEATRGQEEETRKYLEESIHASKSGRYEEAAAKLQAAKGMKQQQQQEQGQESWRGGLDGDERLVKEAEENLYSYQQQQQAIAQETRTNIEKAKASGDYDKALQEAKKLRDVVAKTENINRSGRSGILTMENFTTELPASMPEAQDVEGISSSHGFGSGGGGGGGATGGGSGRNAFSMAAGAPSQAALQKEVQELTIKSLAKANEAEVASLRSQIREIETPVQHDRLIVPATQPAAPAEPSPNLVVPPAISATLKEMEQQQPQVITRGGKAKDIDSVTVRQMEEHRIIDSGRWVNLNAPPTISTAPGGVGMSSQLLQPLDKTSLQGLETFSVSDKTQEKVRELTGRARALQSQRKYAEALATVEQVLSLDPSNRWAAENRDMLKQFSELTEEKVLKDELKQEPQIVQDSRLGIANRQTRVYDIRDLVTRTPDFSGPKADMNATGGGNAAPSSEAANAAPAGTGVDRAEIIKAIEHMIQNTDPASWRPNGDIGSMSELHGNLIVTAGPEQQAKVNELIDKLREARGPQVQMGANIAKQKAEGKLNPTDGGLVANAPFTGAAVPAVQSAVQPPPPAANQAGTFLDDAQVDWLIKNTNAKGSSSLTAEQQRFIERNYNWQRGGAMNDSGFVYHPATQTVTTTDASESSIPMYDVIKYPRNWKELTMNAQPQAGSDEDRLVSGKLSQNVPKIDFREIPLVDVVDFVRDLSGIDIQPNWEVLKNAGIDKSEPVTLKLANVSVGTVIDRVFNGLARNRRIEYQVVDGIVVVSTPDDIAAAQYANAREDARRWREENMRTVSLSHEELSKRLQDNLEQKVVVGSENLGLSADEAASAGLKFTTGNNDLRFTVADDAQVRTLVQLAARKSRLGGAAVADNSRSQETIISTDALLSNSMRANLAYSADTSNTVNVADNPVNLPQEKYLVIDNGGSLTVMQAGHMQHWTDTPERVLAVEMPQEIDVPRIGQLVKFEKTLVKPGEELSIQAEYQLKGDAK